MTFFSAVRAAPLVLATSLAMAQGGPQVTSPADAAQFQSILTQMSKSCSASFTGDATRVLERQLSIDDNDPAIDVAETLRRLEALRGCASVRRQGGFFVCRTGNGYDYYSSLGVKLNSQRCDEVLVRDRSAHCMRSTETNGNKVFSVAQTHRLLPSDSTMTCSGLIFQDPAILEKVPTATETNGKPAVQDSRPRRPSN